MNGTRWSTGESLMMVSMTPVSRTSFESLAASARVRAISSSFHHFHLGSVWLPRTGDGRRFHHKPPPRPPVCRPLFLALLSLTIEHMCYYWQGGSVAEGRWGA